MQQNGPVIVMGDFNAHIGQPYSEHAQTQTNSQGQLLLDMIDRTGHYAASLVDAKVLCTHSLMVIADLPTLMTNFPG